MDRRMGVWPAVLVLVLAVMLPGMVAYGAQRGGAMKSSEPATRVPNGSFEELDGGKLVGWRSHKWAGAASFDRPAEGRSGGHCVTVQSEQGGDAGWLGDIVLKPYSSYRIKGFVKTLNVVAMDGKGALINIYTSKDHPSQALIGTHDWTELEVVFDTEDQDCASIHLGLGGWGQASGQVWFDDLSLECVGSKTLKPSVSIDAAAALEPISKYIYGQFTEHLGHCIYQGIWSEMVDDRKFFYAVGDKESPWRARPESAKVEMSKENVFVGERTPAVSGGVAQEGIAIQKGRDYVGYIFLAGEKEAGPVEVALIVKGKARTVANVELTAEYRKTAFQFTGAANDDNAVLSIANAGKGAFRLGTVSLMPGDNVNGVRKDTLALLKELDSPVYRWPGGNFVSGYNWRDGIGDRDKRPPRKNPAWKGVEHNDFGIDDFMTLVRELGTEPYIAVNSGLGDAKSAAEELEYANGAADTAMGKLRAENGHAEPYGVKFWGIGNEMYGDWQLGHMPLADYVKKHNAYAEAFRTIDPTVKLVGVGATGDWSKTMLANCADHMDLLSEHFYCGHKPGLLSHVRQIPDNVRLKAEAHRKYHQEIPALAGKKIPIALDEWNYWYGPDLYGEIGTRYYLKDALGIAAGLHEYFRNSDIFFMANYAQTVNVIGAIKTSKTAAAFDTTGLVLKLYRHAFGTIPVKLSGDAAPLDVSAAWREDHRALTIGIVNATRERQSLDVSVAGAAFTGAGTLYTITGKNPEAYNEPGEKPGVVVKEKPVTGVGERLDVAPVSVSLFVLETR